MSLEIVFNGKLQVTESENVLALLKEYKIENRKIAIELNLQIVPRDSYGATILSNGDTVEVVQFVGGG